MKGIDQGWYSFMVNSYRLSQILESSGGSSTQQATKLRPIAYDLSRHTVKISRIRLTCAIDSILFLGIISDMG